jgi:hypothetical protein
MTVTVTTLQTETERNFQAKTETCSAMLGRKMPTHGYAEVTAYTRHMVHYSSRSLVNKTSLA